MSSILNSLKMNFEETARVFLLILFPLLIYIYLQRKSWDQRWKGLPPGPTGIPFLGHLLHIVKDPHLKLTKWANEYGKLYTIRLGMEKAVVINDPKVLRDIMNHPAATGKFQTATILLISRGPYGVLSSEGKAWEETRRFCIRNLRTFGLGNKSVEPIILDEAQALVDWIEEYRSKSDNESVVLHDVLKLSAVNTLWTMVSGERLHLGNSEAKMNSLMAIHEKALQRTVKTGLIFFPSLKYIAPVASGFQEYDGITAEIHEFIIETFNKHRKDFVKGSPRDLIDCYIEHVVDMKDPESSFYRNLGELNSVSTIMELFLAGSETTATTLNWSTIYLATHQNVQNKLRDEIYGIIGDRNEPSLRDRSSMPYTEAVIQEIFRYSSIGPQGAMHKTTEDMSYENYTIPKGTILIPNIYGIHNDERIWKDPQNFRPERWILEKENENLKEAMVVFQTGKRSCLGEPLVRDILFLFLTKIALNFNILPHPDITMEEYYKNDVGIVLAAGPHKLIFKSRSR